MGIAVLGPLTIDGVDSHGARDRVVLQALVVRAGEAVDKQVLADALWGEALPASWLKMVQGCIVRLRRVLPTGSIETTPYGYRLVVHEDQLDSRRFERLLARAREHLQDRDADRAAYVVTEALTLWRGRPLPDLDDWEPGRAEAARLSGLRMDAEELRAEAEIVAGRSRTVVEEARVLATAAPFRERRWALLARALYHSGRQTEALDVLGRARRLLRDELGLDPGPELTSLEEAILRQDLEVAGPEAAEASLVCPYRGLLPYEAEDAESFFGRDADVAACLEKLRLEGVLAVVGPSGTGKSSLVRAGVVASLERDGTRVRFMTPGRRPLETIAVLPTRPPFPVLVVDQAEEAVTLCSDPEERASYFARIEEYDGPKVLALRADRLGDLSTQPQFARLLERGLYLVGPLSEDNLRAAIEGPARHAGLRLEPGLVDLLVREVSGEPAALPLLSHVLRQTWELREGPTLTVDGYRLTGGIRDAVAQSADRLYEALDDRQRTHLRDLFLRLVAPGDESGPVRTRVPRTSLALDDAHDRLIERLVDARLLSSDEGEVQIAHEALAREWPRLRAWLEEDVEGQRIFRHLAVTAEAWDAMGRPDSELYRGVRLAGAVDWSGRSAVELTETERTFLAVSQEGAERELRSQRRSNRRLRLALAGIAVLLVAALVAGVLAVKAARTSERQASAAATAARLADSRRLSAQALVATEPDLSLLLGVEALRLDDSLAARSTVYSLLNRSSALEAVTRTAGEILDLDVSPDGVAVFTAGPGGVARHDAGTLARQQVADQTQASGIELSPDGKTLAYGVFLDSTTTTKAPRWPVRLLDATSLEPSRRLGGAMPGTSVEGPALAFSKRGDRLAAGLMSLDAGAVAGVQVWDLDRPGRPLRTVPLDGVRLHVALSPDGDTLYAATRGPDELRAFEVSSGRLLARQPVAYLSERIPPIEVSADGSTLATSHRDGVAVFDARTLERRFVLPSLGDAVASLAFTQDATSLASGFVSGATTVWDLDSRRPSRTVTGHSQPVEALEFSRNDVSLYTVGSDRQLLSWSLDGSNFPPTKQFRDDPEDAPLSFPSPDGRKIVYFTYAGNIQFRDVSSGRLTPPRRVAFDVPSYYELWWSPDSQEVAMSGGSGGTAQRSIAHTLEVWDAGTGAPLARDVDADVDNALYTSDGKRLVTLAERGIVTVLDRQSLRPVTEPVKVGQWSHTEVTLSPDDRTLFVPLVNGSTDVVDLVAGTTWRAGPGVVPAAISFSPDGERVVAIDKGEWGVMRAKSLGSKDPDWLIPPREFTGTSDIERATWSADGAHLFTTGPGALEVWDASSLGHLGTLEVGAADQYPAEVSLPDGHTLLIAHPSGALSTWDLRPAHLRDVACDLAGRNLTREEWANLVGDRAYRKTCPENG